jgi:tetratricopeptide (TPR) repeat protein
MSTLGEILRGDELREHLAAAQQLLLAQNPASALKHVMAALAFAPDNSQALILLAAAHFDLGKLDEARRAAQAAVKAAPESFIAHRVMSMVFVREKNLDLAELHARKSLELNPSDPMTRACLLSVMIADPHRLHEAAAAADEALAMASESPALLSACATAYCNVNRFEKADEIARRAFAIAPEHPGVLAALGLVALRCADSNTALELAEAAMAAAPSNPGVLQLYARVQMRRSRLLAPLWFAILGMSRLNAALRVVLYIFLITLTFVGFFKLAQPYNFYVGGSLLAITVFYVLSMPLAWLILQRLAARASKPTTFRKGF